MINYKEIEGWLTDKEAEFLAESAKGKLCLEIGTFKGKSTTCLSKTARKVFTIDIFAYSKIEDTIKNLESLKNVELIPAFSTQAAYLFNDFFFDLIFIDGDHEYESVKEDIACFKNKLKRGGMLIFHDYVSGIHGDNFGVKQAVDEYYPSLDGIVDSIGYVVI